MKAAETQRAKLIDLIVQAEMVAPSSYMKGRPSSFLSRRFSEMISAHCATLCIRWIGGTCPLYGLEAAPAERLSIGQRPLATLRRYCPLGTPAC